MDASQFEEWTISDLQQAMGAGEMTAVDITLLYLQRIAEFDQQGKHIGSVLEVNPDALFLANACDEERARGILRGPLHGIPVLLKDNIDTADKMHTSAGSVALANSYAQADAFVVEQLRKAGAVILGKTNMTEWANFMTENMPNGYSSRGGQVLNPYGPGVHDVGGSSSGSGAAVSANFTAFAIGTETSGSILSPASQNSIVGLKPTIGLISRRGMIPIAFSQDTAGPMARTVRDVALVLGALTGVDKQDSATYAGERLRLADYSFGLTTAGLNGARIGVAREPYFHELTKSQVALLDAAIQVMKDCGARVQDPVVLPSANEETDYEVLVYEFKVALNAYLQRLPSTVPVHSLADVIAFNEEHAAIALKYGQTILKQSEMTSGTLVEPKYIYSRLRDLRQSRERGLDVAFFEQGFEAVVFPAHFGADIAAKAGYPSLTVPAGYDDKGFPIGVTFCGPAFSEHKLLQFGYAFEQATRHRISPQLL
ncbi:amidase family protein [Sulfoacidibacillus thermotolerans]|uniref:Amidase n=1 Tax=Sulfoacidibacillus thermotolerans TaxID=1765684 RepID=A0A2U3D965_SULT2|nr:amidase family protein [Sulfoacidibacillus thermotolerans]PWI57813.1 amidase [Sulfoacidibacillus thermotolerans]